MRKIYFLFHLAALLLLSGKAAGQIRTIPYQALPAANGSTVGSTMFFGASMNTSTITITFAGPADRWIAFGFGTSMFPTDVFIYSCGQASSPNTLGWSDYYNSSSLTTGVNRDQQQDWTVVSTATVSGQRTVTASRALNTNDPSDAVISTVAPSLSLVWARGATPDYTIAYHGTTNRASGINLQWLSVPVASFAAPSATVCQGSSIHFSNQTTGGQTTYTWSLESGSPSVSTSTNPTVLYTAPGTYSVSLIAANVLGTDTVVGHVTITPTVAPAVSIVQTAGGNPLCSGTAATFTATAINAGASPVYHWQVNGITTGGNNAGFTAPVLNNNDVLSCQLVSNASCAIPTLVASAAITMTVNSSAPASISTSIISGGNPMCAGSAVEFSATPGNGGPHPSFQWQVNGVNTGSNNSSFITSGLADGDIVSCILTSDAPCASSQTANAAPITMTITNILVPSLTLDITHGTNPLCSNDTITVTAMPVNCGAIPFFIWRLNGQGPAGTTPTFTFSGAANGAVLTCTAVSGLSCSSPSYAIAGPITFTVKPSPATPVITAAASLTICAGDSLLLSSSASAGNSWSNGAITPSIEVFTTGIYSLTQMIDGCTSAPAAVTVSIEECLGIASVQRQSAVSIFPNPVRNELTIVAAEKKIVALKLSDLNGKVILKKNYWQESFVQLDLSAEQSGEYILDVILANEHVHFRLIKKD